MMLAAANAAEAWVAPMHYVLAAFTVGLISVYFVTEGRSGPIAALLFVLFGPALGVALMVASMLTTRRRDTVEVEIFGIQFGYFLELMLTCGVVVAFAGAAIYAYEIRDELRASHEYSGGGWLGRMRTGMGNSSDLNSLGLASDATLEEVERAYRELAKQAHPDRGGDVEQFKRLQAAYERAKRRVARRGPAAHHKSQEPQSSTAANDA